jgi:hypothetical protein
MLRSEPSKWREARSKAIERHLAALPAAERAVLESDRKESRQVARARCSASREAREKRNKRFLELLLRGYTQAEIAKVTGAHEITVSKVLATFSPFPKLGHGRRHIASTVATAHLIELDRLATDLLVDRLRVLEMMYELWFENGAKIARRDLRVPSR